MPDEKIVKVIEAKGTRRVYEMDDGRIVEREGGHANWRNNNPGNLKFELPRNASEETRQKRLGEAQKLYDGIVGLDDRGMAIFETAEAGRRAQIRLADRKVEKNPEWTLENYVKFYAKDDYAGKAHHDAYLQRIADIGKENGIDLSKDRKISTLNEKEKSVLVDAMKQVEGSEVGTTRIVSTADMKDLKAYKIVIPAGRDMTDREIYAHMCADIAQRNFLPLSQEKFDRLVGEMIADMQKIPKAIITPAIPDGTLRERGEFDVDGRKVPGYRMNITVEMQQDFLARAKQELKNPTQSSPEPRQGAQAFDGSARSEDSKAPVALLNDATHPGNAMYRQALRGVEADGDIVNRHSKNERENIAGALTAAAAGSEMTRIDSVWRGNGSNLFAVQGANPESPSAVRSHVDIDRAASQSLDRSTQLADAATALRSPDQAQGQQIEQPSIKSPVIV